MHNLNERDKSDLQEKVENLQENWTRLAGILDQRISLARTYVKFHSLAVDIATDLDTFEDDLRGKEASSEVREKWLSVQQLGLQLNHVGKNFLDDVEKVRVPNSIHF